MIQEEFMRLAKAKRELELFIEATKDEDFDAIGARKIVLVNEFHRYITDKELIKGIVDYLQAELDKINKIIEEL